MHPHLNIIMVVIIMVVTKGTPQALKNWDFQLKGSFQTLERMCLNLYIDGERYPSLYS